MQYVPFGKLNFRVSRLGFGTMRLPRIEGEDNKIDRERAIALIRKGIDGGISYVDTAYGYHAGESEIVTGLALKDGYREKVTLTTKLPHWSVNEEKDMNRLLDEQLKKLDVPYLDFYILHALNRDAYEKMSAFNYKPFLEQALKDGRIRHTGFSFHDDKETFLHILNDWDKWEMAQIQHNYLDDENQATEEGLREAGRQGVSIVVMEPLRGGALANPPSDVRAMIDEHESKRSPVDWAFRYLADYPEVATILSGMSTEEQLEDNLRIFNNLTVNGMTEADRAFTKALKEKYLARQPIGCTACQYCQPCPQGVKIPNIFGAYNHAQMFDHPEEFADRYARMKEKGEDGSQCIGCGACETACPQQLNIREWLEKIESEQK
ncbi:MAG: aldo/keto reductase [Clostridia bacterium]|nr:aldo/keto reductase [Clostridia bacterium]